MMPRETYHFGRDYRYQFQGQEVDNEVSGRGNHVVFSERGQDVRLGRLNWRIDSRTKQFPWNSPYAFSENRVLQFIELEGGEVIAVRLRI